MTDIPGKILAVDRGTQGSDHHRVNDRLLMDEVTAALSSLGSEVERIGEDELPAFSFDMTIDMIVSMAQSPVNTPRLGEVEAAGTLVVNSFSSILHTYRSFLTMSMAKRPQIPYARGAVLTSIAPEDVEDHAGDLYQRFKHHLGSDFWLKRGDVHAAHQNDVVQPRSAEDFALALAEMHGRGVQTAVVQQHIEGLVCKYYGVEGGQFFHAQEFETSVTVDDDGGVLESLASFAAEYLDLTVYGGDAVKTDNGWVLIDVNAWPSFSTVRTEAVPAIVSALLDRWRGHQGRA